MKRPDTATLCERLANGYTIFSTESSIGVVGIYGITCHTSHSHIHELLLHTDTVLQTYTFIESLERDMFDERYAVYLYVVSLCTEFDGFGFLASYDGAYIMTVNADNTVTYFTAFIPVQELFGYWKDASDNPVYIGARLRTPDEFHPSV